MKISETVKGLHFRGNLRGKGRSKRSNFWWGSINIWLPRVFVSKRKVTVILVLWILMRENTSTVQAPIVYTENSICTPLNLFLLKYTLNFIPLNKIWKCNLFLLFFFFARYIKKWSKYKLLSWTIDFFFTSLIDLSIFIIRWSNF